MSSSKSKKSHNLLFLSLAALGVVYGDIGTSPLYSINEIYHHVEKGITHADILGFISIVFWALTIIVSFKYIIFVLRADHEGEGGVFALYSLIRELTIKSKVVLSGLLILAAGLLFGDGIITPAISVISAVEGLKVATTTFDPYIIPITIAILSGLFFIQKNGTSQIGKLFGPIIIVWFLAIAATGIVSLMHTPAILWALDPRHAIQFLSTHSFYLNLLTLGSVMLVVTGGEAMYADMGHFGRTPIRLSWFWIVYPSLVLNYFGQGAYLLSGQEVLHGNIFYSMVPQAALIPMVILATLATIIASQALISGAFSLATQAISLGLLPYTKVIHTHNDHEGQIYVPFINWALYFGCILLVITFKSSTNLASAYGLAVSGVMLITSVSMIEVARHIWKWKTFTAYALFIPLAVIDGVFLMSNSLKIMQGGYVPLGIAISILAVMKIWQWGRSHTIAQFNIYNTMSMKELVNMKQESSSFIPRTMIFLTPTYIKSHDDNIPTLKQIFFERYGMMPYNLLLLNVEITKHPYMHENRYIVKKFYEDNKKGLITSVKVQFGFMEDPNVETVLEDLANSKHINITTNFEEWLVHAMHERLEPNGIHGLLGKTRRSIYDFLLRNTEKADEYFGLGIQQPLTIETMPVRLH